MKKLFFFLGVLVILSILIVACQKEQNSIDLKQPEIALKAQPETALTAQPEATLNALNGCTTIQSGQLVNSSGDIIQTGYDEWGYNYQAHMFNGYYCDSYRDAAWCQPWADVELIMKWNDAWLSNKDCDDDGLLDRHYGYPSYIGSGAWLTNHQKGTYIDADGNECHWTYFVKIIAAPQDATVVAGVWYNADGTEIGPEIWGSFAIIQQVENDPCAEIHGLQFNSPDHSGLGGW